MDSEDNKTPVAEAATDSSTDKESFTVVKSKKAQKRKREQDGAGMDTEESVASKRPQFPPISSDKLRVITIFTVHFLNCGVQRMCVLNNSVAVCDLCPFNFFAHARCSLILLTNAALFSRKSSEALKGVWVSAHGLSLRLIPP